MFIKLPRVLKDNYNQHYEEASLMIQRIRAPHSGFIVY